MRGILDGIPDDHDPLLEPLVADHRRSGAQATATAAQPRVEQVAHRIAEHVEPINDNGQENSRSDRQPGGHFHVLASFPAEQSSPTGNPDRQSESEEAQ